MSNDMSIEHVMFTTRITRPRRQRARERDIDALARDLDSAAPRPRCEETAALARAAAVEQRNSVG
ncbi:hypothetical protein [Sorangium sp. So ce362]|uniref:hypothetical protein n=1 Tax=Sorangium sp. So ce362 TaxID=3133303 RepID=UPI003F62DE2F